MFWEVNLNLSDTSLLELWETYQKLLRKELHMAEIHYKTFLVYGNARREDVMSLNRAYYAAAAQKTET